MWSSLTGVATLLALLIAVLPLLDLFIVPRAKRRLAEYLNPDLRPSSRAHLKIIEPAYDTAIRFQAQIFDARFLVLTVFPQICVNYGVLYVNRWPIARSDKPVVPTEFEKLH
jgi:hypothetical protein